MACDMPSAFQKDKDYPINETDERACSLLSRTLSKTDTLINGTDTTLTTTHFFVPIRAVPLPAPWQNYWVNASDSLLSVLFDTLLTDTTLLVTNSGLKDSCYAFFETIQPDGNTHFYISWDLTENNIESYIKITVFSRDGRLIPWQSDAIPLATIAGCTQSFISGALEQTVPKIRARYEYPLPQGKYLVLFTISEPAKIGNFRLVVL